ncbi:Gfo/Idh/MocA family protein [Devosia nitrariae]|uniref:Oxidoreductase n=1 Tax=Devosia nitrariae TaxID=2071872 RepID=A0ABQ5W601_9HYPH|nr:Gfo/Idh/MocA family oxidoreductase [Devosia nitrariae]GLQ55308.1 oxidoreductase [Devosia nitrariae]
MIAEQRRNAEAAAAGLPRVGFLGVGWIGRHRMQALIEAGLVTAAAVADPSPEMAEEARKLAPEAEIVPSFDALLEQELDGIVIATPSALHAEQSIAALEQGLAVFCQKPLGRDEAEVAAVVAAARHADRLLGVDLSYRFTRAMTAIRERIQSDALGKVFAADLVFHNAYGPDKPWFYDKALSGGGCVMDLGIHLIDLALWVMDFPQIGSVSSRLYSGGEPLRNSSANVEDFAEASLTLENDAVVRLSCSWRLNAGCDAEIGACFYGTHGGAGFHNRGGSFYDFIAEAYTGTSRELLTEPPDDWGGRAAMHWARQLSEGTGFDAGAEQLETVARALDSIYRSHRA